MKIDFLLVRPGSDVEEGGFPQHTRPLALGLKARGYQPAILTMVNDLNPIEGVPVFRLDYRDRVTGGERWDSAAAHAYGVSNFRRFAFCESVYVQEEIRPRPHSLLAAEVPAAFAEIGRLFEENDIRCVMHTMMGGEVLREATSIIARARQIPVLYNSTLRYFPNRFLPVKDTRLTVLRKPKIRFADLPAEKQRYIKDYLETKRGAKPVEKDNIIERGFARLVRRFVWEKKFLDPCRLMNGLRRAALFGGFELSKRHWRDPQVGQSYVYYPLQHNDESTIIIGSPDCYRQEYVIEYLSRVLPEGTKLYYKQHPHNPAEASSLRLVRQLASLDNVQLLPLHSNSWDIARDARAVVTLHNTVGFESLLQRKPVIVLGYPAYRGWGVTWDVTDLNDLGDTLDRAMSAEPLSEERLLDFLASFESIHVPGNWFYPPLDPEDMASGVIEIIKGLSV